MRTDREAEGIPDGASTQFSQIVRTPKMLLCKSSSGTSVLVVTAGLSLVNGRNCIQQRRMMTAPVLVSYIPHATTASILVFQKTVVQNAPIPHKANN